MKIVLNMAPDRSVKRDDVYLQIDVIQILKNANVQLHRIVMSFLYLEEEYALKVNALPVEQTFSVNKPLLMAKVQRVS